MASGSINVYNLGNLGVGTDTSPLHDQDGDLLLAQNAIRNTQGMEGGITNRDGLANLNTTAAAGAILGGITVPLDNGDLTTTVFYFAQRPTSGSAESWWSCTGIAAGASGVVTTKMTDWAEDGPSGVAAPKGVFLGGRLYYIATNPSVGTLSPTIRVFNGQEDYQLCVILPATTLSITTLVSDHGQIYVLTHDSGTVAADWVGRVFQMDADTGALTQIGVAFPTGHLPVCLAVHHGLVFVGSTRVVQSQAARTYRLDPVDETAWTLDDTLPANHATVTGLASFGGLLYATTSGSVGTVGQLRVRSLAGVWSVADSTLSVEGVYQGIIPFNGYLYAVATGYTV